MHKIIHKLLCFSLCCTICFGTYTTPVLADEISISIDGEPLVCETAPFIENDRILVPMRSIMEALGYEIQWDSSTRTVTGIKGDTTISLCVNYAVATVNGTYVALDAYPTIVNGSTYVPLRFLADHSGAELVWSAEDTSVAIYTTTSEVEKSIVDICSESIVYIQTNKKQGSGIILSEDGLIATNFHVIENASTIQFKFNDRSIYQDTTSVVAISPENDLAILKIEAENLIPITTTEEPTVGEAIFAIGSPHGEHNVVTEGSILFADQNVINISAVIENGNSGGGLFDTDGNLLGITSFYTDTDYFATPIANLYALEEESTPFDLSEMKTYVYTPSAPSSIYSYASDGYTYVNWEPIYDVDYYKIYYKDTDKTEFSPLNNSTLGNDHWYWGSPYCLGIAPTASGSMDIQITSVRDGVEYEKSDVYTIVF